MKKQVIEQVLDNLKPGAKINFFSEDANIIKEIATENNCRVTSCHFYDNMGAMMTIMKNNKGKSKYQQVISILQDYKSGHVDAPGIDTSYVRTVVSQHNNRTGSKFKVSKKGDIPQIYVDIEDREHLTQDEYDMIHAQYMSKLAEFKTRVMPGAFFSDDIIEDEDNDLI